MIQFRISVQTTQNRSKSLLTETIGIRLPFFESFTYKRTSNGYPLSLDDEIEAEGENRPDISYSLCSLGPLPDTTRPDIVDSSQHTLGCSISPQETVR
jgi:hypothetical protein